MQLKLANIENKLKIKLSKDFDILQKKIGNHENNIKRIQNLCSKKNWHKGEHLGPLMRQKQMLKNQNEIIINSKKIDIMAQFFKPTDMSQSQPNIFSSTKNNSKSGRSNVFAQSQQFDDRSAKIETETSQAQFPSLYKDPKARISLKNQAKLQRYKDDPDLIKFYIRQQFGSDIPVNAHPVSHQSAHIDEHYKVEKYLKGGVNKDDDNTNLCYLYDDYLEEFPDRRKEEQALAESQKLAYADVRNQIYNMLNLKAAKHKDY